jgi:hypothetical protein
MRAACKRRVVQQWELVLALKVIIRSNLVGINNSSQATGTHHKVTLLVQTVFAFYTTLKMHNEFITLTRHTVQSISLFASKTFVSQ